MAERELKEELELVRQLEPGFMMFTPWCYDYQTSHDDCKGCPSCEPCHYFTLGYYVAAAVYVERLEGLSEEIP